MKLLFVKSEILWVSLVIGTAGIIPVSISTQVLDTNYHYWEQDGQKFYGGNF